MEIKWLEDFLALAASRSFSRAAEARNVTQPAFSRRIRSLEIWLGFALFDRTSYPVTLTSEGRSFLETAEGVTAALYEARAALQGRGSDHLPPASFALTALHTLTTTFLPKWLTALRERLGPVGSRVLPENFALCLQAITEGGYDFFLSFHHPNVPLALEPSLFPHQVVGHDSLVAVAQTGAAARWRQSDPALPLLQYSRGSFLGLLTAVAQRQPGAPPTKVIHVNENSMAEALKSMALEGHGIAYLPMSLVADTIASGALERVSPEMAMEIRLYRNAARARPVADRVWEAAQALGQHYATSA